MNVSIDIRSVRLRDATDDEELKDVKAVHFTAIIGEEHITIQSGLFKDSDSVEKQFHMIRSLIGEAENIVAKKLNERKTR